MKISQIIILLLFSISACDTVVDVDMPEPPELLVVNCLFDSNGKWTANVSKTKYILDNNIHVLFKDAIITIIRPDESRFVMEGRFTPDNNDLAFFYAFTDHEPVVYDQPYTIQVEREGFPTAFSTSVIPSPVKIGAYEIDTTSQIARNDDGFIIGGYEATQNDLMVRFTDLPGESYYALRLKRSFVHEYWINDSIRQDTVVNYLGLETNNAILEEYMRYSNELLFSDKTFADQEFEIRADYGKYALENALSLTIELCTVPKAYYLYQLTREQQEWVEGDPFAEPTQVKTNIENGYGIFAGISLDTVNIAL